MLARTLIAIAAITLFASFLYSFEDIGVILKAEQSVLSRAEKEEARRNLQGAEKDYVRALTLARQLSSQDYHIETDVLWKLGHVYSETKQSQLAEKVYNERLQILSSRQKRIDLDLGIAYFDLQSLYEGLGRDEEAKKMMESGVQFYNHCKTAQGFKSICDRRLGDVQGLYGAYMFEQRRFSDAEPYLRAVAARDDESIRPEILEAALLALSSMYFQRGEVAISQASGRRALALRNKYPAARLVPLPPAFAP